MNHLRKTIVYTLTAVAAVWLTVKFFVPIGMPFLIGRLLSKLAEKPVVRITQRTHIPRGAVSFAAMTVLSMAIVLLFWLFGRAAVVQLEHLGRRIPQMLSALSLPLGNLRRAMLHFAAKLPEGASVAAQQWIAELFAGSSSIVDSISQWLLTLAAKLLSWIPEIAMFLITVVLSAYFFAAQRTSLRGLAQKYLPEAWKERLSALSPRIKGAIGGYVRAQLRLSLVTFGVVVAGLLLLRQKNAIVIAALTALVDALPVFGAGIVLIPWGIVAFFAENTVLGVGLLVLYALAAISRTALEPRFLGKQMGLSPILTLLALYSGFRLFGALGMLVVPIAAMLIKQVYDLMENS